ncbi:DJ-1/PfpI family protein [Ideonella alba]|nr:DJ-1/PfpI family protein [Ideonella alba]
MSDCTTVLLLAFDEMELLDFAGPYEVFTTAARVHARRQGGAGPRFQLITASADGRPVRARAGLAISVDHALAQAPATDWLLVPGGVIDGVLAQPATLAELARRAGDAAITASVCTGAFVLAAAGIVTDQAVTTHWEDAEDLAQRFPALQVRPERRWIDNGRSVTSAGIAAGIDMALHLVARAAGPELAQATARQMDYPWSPSP